MSLDVGHQRDAPVGHAVELKNLGSSLFGSFRIHNTSAGDEALERIQDGTLTSVSIRFTPLASRDLDGVRQHRRAYLDSVALTATPVYPQATIVGVRKGSRREASDPSARERVVLDLERLDQKLGALMSAHFEEWFEQRQLGRRLYSSFRDQLVGGKPATNVFISRCYLSVRLDKWETRADLADRRHLPLDQARLRPNLRDRAELVESQAAVFRGEYDRVAGGRVDRSSLRNGWKTPVGDDRERLRGLPALSKGGMSSAIPGTDPEAALLETERRF